MIISFINEDGGCGKTTLTSSTAEILASRGKRVLLVDASPKCSLTRLYLHDEEPSFESTVHQVFNHNILPVITNTDNKNIDLLPGHQFLESLHGFQYEMLLREHLQKLAYDFILIDTFNNGTLVNAAICASDYIIIPSKTSRDSVEGVKKILDLLSNLNVQNSLNVQVLEILLNMYDDTSSAYRVFGELSENELFTNLFNKDHIIPRLASFTRYQWNYKNVGVLGGNMKAARQLRRFVIESILKEPYTEAIPPIEEIETPTKDLEFDGQSENERLGKSMEEIAEENHSTITVEDLKTTIATLKRAEPEPFSYIPESDRVAIPLDIPDNKTPYELEQERIKAREQEEASSHSGNALKDLITGVRG